MDTLNELTDAIIGAAMEEHRTLGPGLLESTYEMCLCDELAIRDSLLPIHDVQLLSYLKLGCGKIGLLINFNVEMLKNGLRRRVLGLVEEVTVIASATSAFSAVN